MSRESIVPWPTSTYYFKIRIKESLRVYWHMAEIFLLFERSTVLNNLERVLDVTGLFEYIRNKTEENQNLSSGNPETWTGRKAWK
jgi:hypothetical protein